jgi:hypothetical protein
MNYDADLGDLANRIRGLFEANYRDKLGLNLHVNVNYFDDDMITIQFIYNDREDPAGPDFVYEIPRRKLRITGHGEVLFEPRRLSRSRSRSRSRNSSHLINTLDMTANQRAALTDKIQRECNRVFYGRSRGGATRRKARRTKKA